MRWPLAPDSGRRAVHGACLPARGLAGHLARPGPARPLRVRPGQVVIAEHPDRAGFLLVKRAVRPQDGGWWLESDNHDVPAVDSRRFGPVRPDQIQGRVLLRYRRGRAAS